MITASASTSDLPTRIDYLEACRQLNQADYMDDCPFFGTSVLVEPHRLMYRAVRQAVLEELAQLHDSVGRRALAAIRHAEADAVSELSHEA
jgi:hypothetical protein